MTNGKKTIFKAILIEKLDNGNVKEHKINKFRNCFFFGSDEEYCCKIEWFISDMLENDIDEIKLHLARRETDVPYFYCKYYYELGDKSEGTCGRMCKGYQPRNGKSGACRHYGYVYEQTDRCFTLKLLPK